MLTHWVLWYRAGRGGLEGETDAPPVVYQIPVAGRGRTSPGICYDSFSQLGGSGGVHANQRRICESETV